MNAPGRDEDIERRALAILRESLDLDSAAAEQLIDERCGADEFLRDRVLALLDCTDRDEAFASSQSDEDPIGSRLGPFRIEALISRGGMGNVYLGVRKDEGFVQHVAVKLIRRGLDFDEIRARFLRERRILARLSHPNLAHFVDGGVSADGRPWLALEYVEGVPITAWCDAQRLDLRARVRLFLEVCGAVQYAHSQLVIHRDLKPSNVLVDAQGHVRLLDFGIAKLLYTDDDDTNRSTFATVGTPALTPEYAAPEQYNGHADRVSVDVYSLGVMLFELITGVLPYRLDRRDRAGSERTVRETPPQSLLGAIARAGSATSEEAQAQRLAAHSASLREYRNTVRGDLSRIVSVALAKEPLHRYASVQAFADDLTRWMVGVPVRVSGNRRLYRLGKFLRRNRLVVALTMVAALVLIAVTAFALHSAARERMERDNAIAEARRADALNNYLMLMLGNHASGNANDSYTHGVLTENAEEAFKRLEHEPQTSIQTILALSDLYAGLGDALRQREMLARLLQWPGIETYPPLLARARMAMASAEYEGGNRDSARVLLGQAQAFWRSDLAQYGRQFNASHTLEGEILSDADRVSDAVALLKSATDERRRMPGGADIDFAKALTRLSLSTMAMGDYDASMRYATEGRQVLENLGQANSIDALALLNYRVKAEQMSGRYAEAEPRVRYAIDRLRTLYGSTTQLASALRNFGQILRKTQRPAEAIAPLREALNIGIERQTPNGRDPFLTRIALADALTAAGRNEEALSLADETLAIARAAFAGNNNFVGMALRARALAELALRRNDNAREDLDAAEAAFRRAGACCTAYLESLQSLRAQLSQR